MRLSSLAGLLAAMAFAPACGGESRTYTVDETKAAFARHGFALEAVHRFGDVRLENDAILASRNSAAFFVVVTTDSEAEEVWPDFERMQDGDSFDARRANVGVFSDDGPPSRDRRKVLAALESLPDRGAPVVVAGR